MLRNKNQKMIAAAEKKEFLPNLLSFPICINTDGLYDYTTAMHLSWVRAGII